MGVDFQVIPNQHIPAKTTLHRNRQVKCASIWISISSTKCSCISLYTRVILQVFHFMLFHGFQSTIAMVRRANWNDLWRVHIILPLSKFIWNLVDTTWSWWLSSMRWIVCLLNNFFNVLCQQFTLSFIFTWSSSVIPFEFQYFDFPYLLKHLLLFPFSYFLNLPSISKLLALNFLITKKRATGIKTRKHSLISHQNNLQK